MKEVLKKFHLVPNGDESLLFHVDSSSVLAVDQESAKILAELGVGKSSEEIQKALGVEGEDVLEVKSFLEKAMGALEGKETKVLEEKKSITLYLNVSNACNLKCVYCYADGGSYKSAPGMMDKEIAFTSLDQFYEKFGHVGNVMIFGGEPLMQAKLVPEICEYALQKARDRNVGLPGFMMVTNGTLLTEENVATLAKYNFAVTVSVDGPQEINDLLRPTTGGRGSFEKISQGLKRLNQAGIKPNIESTFTAKHMELGITPKGILEFVRDNYEVPSITVAPVASTPGSELSIGAYYEQLMPLYREAVRFSLETLNTDRPMIFLLANQVLQYVLTRTRKAENKFCYADLGGDLFCVSSSGSIYPCQMMNDREEFKMGHIKEPSFDQLEEFKEVQARFAEMNKQEMQCRNCWARHLCFMCIAGVEIETKKIKSIPKHRCDLMQEVIEEILIYVTKIRGDEELWTQFCKNYFGVE